MPRYWCTKFEKELTNIVGMVETDLSSRAIHHKYYFWNNFSSVSRQQPSFLNWITTYVLNVVEGWALDSWLPPRCVSYVLPKNRRLQDQSARFFLVAEWREWVLLSASRYWKQCITSQRGTGNQYIKNFDFNYPQTNSIYTVTAISGHLLEHDFPNMYNNWQSCDPSVLFDAPIFPSVRPRNKSIEENLMTEARKANLLMIWTDCDREGENIGWEILHVCRKARADIPVKRARFSAIIAQ